MGQLKPTKDGPGMSIDGLALDAASQENGDETSTRLGTYLRRLREGYGYTLRKVEERATAMGEAQPVRKGQGRTLL